MKKISTDTRNAIVHLLETGLSARKVAERVGVCRATVNRVRAQTMPNAEKCPAGRPAKLTPHDKRKLVRLVTSGKADTATQLQKELQNTIGVYISAQTVRNALKKEGLRAVVKKKRPRLLARHIKSRYEFALRHQHWTIEDWKRIIFSDETKINRLGSDGRKWVWKEPSSKLMAQHVNGTVKFGGGSLMIWSCMTASGVGYVCCIEGRMNAEDYTHILNIDFLDTLEHYGLETDNIIFQQDNDPKHTSRLATQWFENNGIEVLDWPAQSPDLNPIEHLWWHLKGKLAEYENEPTSMHELWVRVEAEWGKIPKQMCLGLIESMPKRVAAVLEAKGGYTKY
jgi:transposase